MTSGPETTGEGTSRPTVLVGGVLAATLVLLVVLLVVLPLGARLWIGDRVHPNVTVYGIDVGGRTLEEAAALLAEREPGGDETVELVDPGSRINLLDDRTWVFTRRELGLVPDPWLAADAAYRAGRDASNPVARWFAPLLALARGTEVASRVPLAADASAAALAELKPEVDIAPREADLRVENGELVETAPATGRSMNVDATLASLMAAARAPGPLAVDIVTEGTAPRIGDATNVSDAYRKIVGTPVRLVFRGDIEHLIGEERLSSWVSLLDLENEQGDAVPSIVVDEAAIRDYLAPFARQVDRPPSDARFAYDIDTGLVTLRRPAETGFRMDVTATAQAVIDAAYSEPRVAEIVVDETRPAVPSGAIAEGQEGLAQVSSAGTGIAGAPEGRLRNLLLASDRINGVSIAPGDEFSFNDALGAVSEDDGFDMVQIDGAAASDGESPETVGLGGGIEQLASTVFRAAFWAGLPITERRAPPHRIGWLEPPIGLDAAAGTGGADVRFVNDSELPMIVSAEVDASREALMVRIFGSPRERSVELVGPDVSDLSPAGEPVERIDPRLEPGRRVQVGWAREGANVAVQRIVRENGAEVLRDAFVSSYRPASDVVAAGPGG